jgi:hypothetical protein
MKFRIKLPWFSIEIRSDDSRSRAHDAFDPLWRTGKMSRNAAYRWLANELGLSREECHISLFDKDMCQRVINVCQQSQ